MSDDLPPPDATAAVGFADLDLPEPLLRALAGDGYDTPSPIQAAIIPHVLAGRDVIGQAQTGTGKTAAFALPLLAQIHTQHLSQDESAGGPSKARPPAALVLAPTRELALQVADAFDRYARHLASIRTLAVYGGADIRGQATALRRGVDVVVGTPGRVLDHMRRGTLDVSALRTLVLDEADEMLRMGFVEDVETVLAETPPGRQVALFSATMPPAIRQIAERQLTDPQRINIRGEAKTADTVRQRYWRATGATKFDALCRLLAFEPVDAAIVFVRTRAATAELALALQDAGFPAAALSGDVPQNQRERIVDALRQGQLKLVVATDVAARGIDVSSISHVFNFDAPEDAEAYIHRIGRTGRAGRDGEAVLFVENRQRRLLQNIERATGQPIEKMDLPTQDQIHQLQLERFADQLKQRLLRQFDPATAEPGQDPPVPALREFIHDIADATGREPADVAAFLVGPAMQATLGNTPPPPSPAATPRSSRSDPSGTTSPPASPPPSASRGSRSTTRSKLDRPAAREPIGGDTQTYRTPLGRDHGINPGHLVGAIANETGLDGQDIGRIQIFDDYSTLQLPAGMPPKVFDLLQNTQVLGHALQLAPEHETAPGHAPTPESKISGRATTPKTKPAKKVKKSGPKPAVSSSAKAKASRDTGFPKMKDSKTRATPPPKKKSKTATPSASKLKKKKSFVSKMAKKKTASKRAEKSKPGAGAGGHSLSPAPFAGGKPKPRRTNKKPRPK